MELPHARTLVVVEKNSCTPSKSKQPEDTVSFYLSSRLSGPAEPFARLIRGHWAGSEIRNHWVRDALWFEDKTRSRNWKLNANLAVLRAALIAMRSRLAPTTPWPQIFEKCAFNPASAASLLSGKPLK